MNSMTRLSRVSAHLMTLTGFFHGVIRRMPFAEAGPPELKPYIVRYHILKQIERPGPHHPLRRYR